MGEKIGRNTFLAKAALQSINSDVAEAIDVVMTSNLKEINDVGTLTDLIVYAKATYVYLSAEIRRIKKLRYTQPSGFINSHERHNAIKQSMLHQLRGIAVTFQDQINEIYRQRGRLIAKEKANNV